MDWDCGNVCGCVSSALSLVLCLSSSFLCLSYLAFDLLCGGEAVAWLDMSHVPGTDFGFSFNTPCMTHTLLHSSVSSEKSEHAWEREGGRKPCM